MTRAGTGKTYNYKSMDVEQKGGEVFVLRKREIENYYSPRIVKEILSEKGFEVDDLKISSFEDVNQ